MCSMTHFLHFVPWFLWLPHRGYPLIAWTHQPGVLVFLCPMRLYKSDSQWQTTTPRIPYRQKIKTPHSPIFLKTHTYTQTFLSWSFCHKSKIQTRHNQRLYFQGTEVGENHLCSLSLLCYSLLASPRKKLILLSGAPIFGTTVQQWPGAYACSPIRLHLFAF